MADIRDDIRVIVYETREKLQRVCTKLPQNIADAAIEEVGEFCDELKEMLLSYAEMGREDDGQES